MSEIEHNKNLRGLNTFNVEAKASSFLQLNSVVEIERLNEHLSSYDDILILGGGSNLLFVNDYAGLVIYPQLFGVETTSETRQDINLRVSASENWHEFVTSCLNDGYYGLENLALIPGTVGAAPVQNVGAYGVEVEKFIESVECFDLQENKFVCFKHLECQFSYRESRFKKAGQGRYLVCYVNFKLNKKASPVLSYAPLKELSQENQNTTAKDVYNWVCHLRKEKLPDPNELANAGSFFKNPIVSKNQFLELKKKFPNVAAYPSGNDFKVAAGWLIDDAGLKGKTIEGVGIHKNQALVLVNYNESDGTKIWELARFVMEKIKAIYDIELEPEVRVLGLKN